MSLYHKPIDILNLLEIERIKIIRGGREYEF